MSTTVPALVRCYECGGPLDDVDGLGTHPSCDPSDPDAAAIRQRCADEWAVLKAAGMAGQAAAIAHAPDDHAAAVAIIHRAAVTMRMFSSNDLRDTGWEQLASKVRGGAFTTAVRRGWLRHAGYEPSTSPATHGHDVKRWESQIHVPARAT